MQHFEFRAMGCHMLAALDSDDEHAVEALAEVPTWFEEWEDRLSRFRPESELNQLNRVPERAVRVSDVLWQVFQRSLDAAQMSKGLVTPAVLDALEAAGYNASFDSLKLDDEARAEPAHIGDWRAIEYDAQTQTICLPRGMRLDFGGVAKGWAADQAVRRLSAYAPALVDAGGDIAISGPMSDGGRWPVAVADPLDPDRDLALLRLSADAVATSGRDYRRWKRHGKMQHHIIDPRTGQPAQTDVLSATVVAPNASDAEVAAKVALILGSHDGLQWIEDRDELAGLFVLEDGRIVRSRQMNDYVWSESIALFENQVVPAWS